MIYKNMEGCGVVPQQVLSLYKVISINVASINRYQARDVIHLKNIFLLPDNIAKINPIFKECEPESK
jgi:hypothetical protein